MMILDKRNSIDGRVGILLAVLLCCVIGGQSCARRQSSRQPPLLVPRELAAVAAAEFPNSENPDARADWFMFQRSYPDGIPTGARESAWMQVLESRRRIRAQSEIVPAAAKDWRLIGPAPTLPYYSNIGLCSGRVNTLAVSPANSRIVLVGSSTGGIWRSADAGNSFVPVSDDQVDLAVGSISFSRSNPSIVYAGMGDTKLGYLGTGVLKSTDEGQTWARVNNASLPSPATISKVEVDPADPNRVYIAQYSKLTANTVSSSGVYLSTNGGVNWTLVQQGAPRDVAIDAGNSRIVYAGLSQIDSTVDPPFGLYRSTDRGNTWSMIFQGPGYSTRLRRDIRVVTTPANPQQIVVYMGGTVGQDFDVHFRISTDGGASWSTRGASGFDTAQIGYNTYLVADPRNANTLYLGSRDVYRSTDGGSTWLNLTQSYSIFGDFYDYSPSIAKAHADQHAFAFSPTSSDQFYIGNDGGVWRTGDGGASFQSLNASLSLSQLVGLAVHPTDSSVSYAGTQDNGVQRRLQGSANWFEFLPGDGGNTVINPLDPGNVFVTYVQANIFRFYNDGRSFDRQVAYNDTFGEFGSPRMAFYPPFVGNGVDATLYLGTWRLFVSPDAGESWSAPAGSTDLTKGFTERGPDVISAIGVSTSDTTVICTGSSMGRAMLSSDGGATWKDVSAGLPDRSITSVTFDRSSSSRMYVTLSGYGTGHVFRTTDSGATWVDMSSGLPDIPTSAFLIDPLIPDQFYVGTDVGVFRSTDGGETWREFSRGMPPVVVHKFAAQPDGVIQAATYGRGVFEIVGRQRPVIDSATFNGKKLLTISGSGFGDAPTVLINGADKSGKIESATSSSIILRSKMKKLGLGAGDNLIQVISSDVPSSVFTLRL